MRNLKLHILRVSFKLAPPKPSGAGRIKRECDGAVLECDRSQRIAGGYGWHCFVLAGVATS